MENAAPLPLPQFTKRYQLVTKIKSGGVTYTPEPLADFVASQIAAAHTFTGEGPLRILDPAVGDGALLLSLLRAVGHREIQIFGFDTDRNAVELAKERIATAFPHADIRMVEGDFLQYVAEHAASRENSTLFSTKAKAPTFDLIIANPPYVRTQIMGAKQAQELGAAFGLMGRVDLYAAFLVAMAQVLAPCGTAGVIVSNRFMTTRAGASVRGAVTSQFHLRHVWDLGDTKLFDAAVLPAVLLAHGTHAPCAGAAAFTSIYETSETATALAPTPLEGLMQAGIIAVPDGRRFQVRHGTLNTGGDSEGIWRIANSSTDAWLATVEAHTWKRFGGIGKVRVGVKTCADKVFIRRDWQDMPEHARPELLRPLTTHHIARRFRAAKPKHPRAILYPHTAETGKRTAVDLNRYPKSRAYLESHRSTLNARTYVIEANRRWYEIWVPQDPAAWSAPKLVFRDISERPTFWIDPDGSVVNGDCYWMVADKPGSDELLWLAAAVANSTFIETFYDHRFNNKLYAGRRRFITQYVEQFPLPDPDTSLGRRIMDMAKQIFAHADDDEVASLEVQLNALVWQAFGLAVEEGERQGNL